LVELRSQVLRYPLGLEYTAEQLAAESGEYHFGCKVNNRFVGCLVLRPLKADIIQMRQVAVASDFQRMGIGCKMVLECENFARKSQIFTVILHSRESAVPFYEKLGYIKYGERFEEVGIPHWMMKKEL
jgi:N-acetylglutamate synthase-like GNAT family acetyltransferase